MLCNIIKKIQVSFAKEPYKRDLYSMYALCAYVYGVVMISRRLKNIRLLGLFCTYIPYKREYTSLL